MAVFDNLVKQFGIYQEGRVLLLNGGIDESRLFLVGLPPKPIRVPILLSLLLAIYPEIHTDTFLQVSSQCQLHRCGG